MHTGMLPAPKMITYNNTTALLRWHNPSIQHSNVNTSTDLRITHYAVYITDLQTPEQSVNITVNSTSYSLSDLLSNSCNLSVLLSAYNTYGEGKKSTTFVINGKTMASVLQLSP